MGQGTSSRPHLECTRGALVRQVIYLLCRRKGHPTPLFLPGESHGQRSLVGFSPWGHKESDLTE